MTVTRRSFIGASAPLVAALAACGTTQEAAPKARQAITIEYWSRFNQQAAVEVEDKRIAEFEQKFGPTKVAKTVTGGEYQQKLDVAFASGNPPDTSSVGNVPTFAGRNVTLELDKNAAVQKELNDYQAFLLNRCKWQGKLNGLPYIADVRAMIYRKDAIREAGLDATKLPDTWEELRTLGRRIAKWEGDTITRVGFNVPKAGNNAHDLFLVLHDEVGGETAYDDSEKPTKARFNGAAGRQALQLLVDLVNKDRVDAQKQPAVPQGQNALVAGIWAANWTSAGDINAARRSAPDQLQNLAVAFTPKLGKRLTFAGGSYLMAKKDTKGPDASAELMLYLTQGAGAVDISTATNSVPARKSASNSEYVKDPLIKPFFDSIEHGRTNIIHALSTQIRDAIAKEVELAIKQEKGVQAALDDAQRTVQELLLRSA